MARKSLTDKGVEALKPRAARFAFPDPQLAGHYVRVQPSGAKSFVCVARGPNGKQVWTTIGDVRAMRIEQASQGPRIPTAGPRWLAGVSADGRKLRSGRRAMVGAARQEKGPALRA